MIDSTTSGRIIMAAEREIQKDAVDGLRGQHSTKIHLLTYAEQRQGLAVTTNWLRSLSPSTHFAACT
jgi:hypothetical protein